ncbi:MAG TPA: polyprenyl diphosphate synthase [Steroidobacteraceae bacterium]|jgi:undecaprenyl diphosphate synthase|nr:polyprenyl diphosphate synthase [Steroidobacteraceae bacterium]
MHVAIIMDGNGRWASQSGLPRTVGHRAGAKAVDRVVETAARHGISTLTLYAFSADNWRRPKAEVSALFALLQHYLSSQTSRCLEQSIRINVIGRRDRLPADVLRAIERSERTTAHCGGMRLRIAVDYSSQYSLMESCKRMSDEASTDPNRFRKHLADVDHSATGAPDVDLLIRTGGEKRLSDFLLWECAYAELHFVDCFWPDFDERAFTHAINEYGRRERRFGQVGATAALAAAE